jgi:hypothetical protein
MVNATMFKTFKNSSFSKDCDGYENLTQNALNKKMLKWNNQLKNFKGTDKYAIKYYIRKEFETESRLIWLQYLLFIELNLIIMQKFYNERKLEHDIYNHKKHREYLKKRIQCECGLTYTPRNKQVHFKTQKHLKTIGLLNEGYEQFKKQEEISVETINPLNEEVG